MQEKGISVFSGSLNDHRGRLGWVSFIAGSYLVYEANKLRNPEQRMGSRVTKLLERANFRREQVLIYSTQT